MKKRIYVISLCLFLFDQLTKLLAINFLKFSTSKTIIPGFFELTYAENTGGAFSVLEGNVLLLSIIGIIMLIIGIKQIEKTSFKNKLEEISAILLLGGLFGNLIDRIFRGAVIDFLDFNIFGYDYPIFNMADIFLVIGVILLIYNEVRNEIHENRKRRITS